MEVVLNRLADKDTVSTVAQRFPLRVLRVFARAEYDPLQRDLAFAPDLTARTLAVIP